MSAQLKGKFSNKIDHSNWRVDIAKQMMNWKDPMVEDDTVIISPPVGTPAGKNHYPIPVSCSLTGCVWCVLCCLETRIWKHFGIQALNTCDQSSNIMQRCFNANCDIIAHSYGSSENRWMVFNIPEFMRLTCFEITHDKLCTGLFLSSIKKAATCNNQTCTKYNELSSNEICKNIMLYMQHYQKCVPKCSIVG